MYKVFFNRTEFLIVEKGNLNEVICFYQESRICEGIPNLKTCLSWLKNDEEVSYIYETENVDRCWREFKSNFKLVLASGGLVYNERKELLVIFRNGIWDLPKGKVEKGESVKDAAKREVEEETGVEIIKQSDDISDIVYHVYYFKEKLILKKTTWYKMIGVSANLTPQIEEGITEVRWMSSLELKNIFSINTYPSIKNLPKFSISQTTEK